MYMGRVSDEDPLTLPFLRINEDRGFDEIHDLPSGGSDLRLALGVYFISYCGTRTLPKKDVSHRVGRSMGQE